jgi:hypothetical protein
MQCQERRAETISFREKAFFLCPKRGLLPFEPDSPEWFAWVTEQDSFRFVGKQGRFTAHHEWRVPKGAW